MKSKLLIPILCLLALVAIPLVSADDMNVTASQIGTTYIDWHWDSGYTITHMLIDGQEICGYNTIGTTFLQSNLKPDSLHTIFITDDTNTGYSTATTLSSNATVSSGGGDGDDSSGAIGALAGLIAGLIGAVLILGRSKK